MFLIAHRGNTRGPSQRENEPAYCLEAVTMGYNVEIDVWYIDGDFYFGHDKPEYISSKAFILSISDKAWYHAKNIAAMIELQKMDVNFFGHDQDDCVLTSKGYLWAFPDKEIAGCICVMPERNDRTIKKEYKGICSDYIENYGKF